MQGQCYLFIVAVGSDILGQSRIKRRRNWLYLKENYGEDEIHMLKITDPKCQGLLEEWSHTGEGRKKIRVIMVCKEKPSMIKMLEEADVEKRSQDS